MAVLSSTVDGNDDVGSNSSVNGTTEVEGNTKDKMGVRGEKVENFNEIVLTLQHKTKLTKGNINAADAAVTKAQTQ